MMDFNGAFGAYIFHEDEINRAAEALTEAYLNGYDINDSEIAASICARSGLNPSNFSEEDVRCINKEIGRRLN